MARIHIGKRSLQGSLQGYCKRFDLLEVRLDPSLPLRPATLRRWRKSVPPQFAFSVVLPPLVAELRSSPEADAALEQTLTAARILEAPCLLLTTPLSVTPTAVARKRLADLSAKIPRDVVRLVWEPAGIWESEDAFAVADRLGLVVVGDAAREPLMPGPVAYTRLRGLGDSRRLSPARLDRVVEELSAFKDAYVVVETDQILQVAKTLRESAAMPPKLKPRAARVRGGVQPLRADDEEQE